jgi:hypothetical protein
MPPAAGTPGAEAAPAAAQQGGGAPGVPLLSVDPTGLPMGSSLSGHAHFSPKAPHQIPGGPPPMSPTMAAQLQLQGGSPREFLQPGAGVTPPMQMQAPAGVAGGMPAQPAGFLGSPGQQQAAFLAQQQAMAHQQAAGMRPGMQAGHPVMQQPGGSPRAVQYPGFPPGYVPPAGYVPLPMAPMQQAAPGQQQPVSGAAPVKMEPMKPQGQ